MPTDRVKVHYSGWTTDGKLFDSSVSRGKPLVFPLNRVIAGWAEGVALMVVGEKRRLWIPAKLAYEGHPDKPQGMLVFDVELLDIIRIPAAPADVAAPPSDAQTTASGLVTKVIVVGTGTRHPTGKSTVRVHYTGWTTDGQMFDSSMKTGASAIFKLGETIPGWIEGIPLMVEGETRRFWIPQNLAYKGAQGKPAGMLVFEVQLIEVLK